MRCFLSVMLVVGFLFCGTGGLNASTITITFDEGTLRPIGSSVNRFEGGELVNNFSFTDWQDYPAHSHTWMGATYAGFVFDHFGITSPSKSYDTGFYRGAAFETTEDGSLARSQAGFNDNGTTAYIYREDGGLFSFLGGYFTPAYFETGFVTITGYLGDEILYTFDWAISLPGLDGEPTYLDFLAENEEYAKTEIDKISFVALSLSLIDPVGKATEGQIVFDNLSFFVDTSRLDTPTSTPEPATMLIFAGGIAGLAFRRFRKKQ